MGLGSFRRFGFHYRGGQSPGHRISFGILTKRRFGRAKNILPVYRLQHEEWAPRRKCRVYNENYAVNRAAASIPAVNGSAREAGS